MKNHIIYIMLITGCAFSQVSATWYEKVFAAWCLAAHHQASAVELPSPTATSALAIENTTICVTDSEEKMQFPKAERLTRCLEESAVAQESWVKEKGILPVLAKQLARYYASGPQVWRTVYTRVTVEKQYDDRYLIGYPPAMAQVPGFLNNKSCAVYDALRACQVKSERKKAVMRTRGNVKIFGRRKVQG